MHETSIHTTTTQPAVFIPELPQTTVIDISATGHQTGRRGAFRLTRRPPDLAFDPPEPPKTSVLDISAEAQTY